MATTRVEISEVKNIVYKIIGFILAICISIISYFAVKTLNGYDNSNKEIQGKYDELLKKIDDKFEKQNSKFETINQIQNLQMMQGQRIDFLENRMGVVEKKVGLDPLYQRSYDLLKKTKEFERK